MKRIDNDSILSCQLRKWTVLALKVIKRNSSKESYSKNTRKKYIAFSNFCTWNNLKIQRVANQFCIIDATLAYELHFKKSHLFASNFQLPRISNSEQDWNINLIQKYYEFSCNIRYPTTSIDFVISRFSWYQQFHRSECEISPYFCYNTSTQMLNHKILIFYNARFLDRRPWLAVTVTARSHPLITVVLKNFAKLDLQIRFEAAASGASTSFDRVNLSRH